MNYNTKKRALKTTERPRDILSREIGVISPATNLFLPNQKHHIDKLTKIRRKQNIIICEDDIPFSIKNTYSQEIFLLYDSGLTDISRVLLFSTETHMLYLENSNAWFCDGTFKSCPREFEQLYTIMGRIKGQNIP
ncbi:hypothetical protein DMUE_0540, partial [Dictyocoela muelleri]